MLGSVAVGQSETLAQNGHDYTEWLPSAALADRLVCLWIDPARPRRQPVLPDACIDVVWDGQKLCVAGPDTRAMLVDSAATIVGVRFRPGAAPGFLGVPASALLDARLELRELWGPAADDLAARLGEAAPHAAAALLERALAERRPFASAPDALFDGLLLELRALQDGRGTLSGLAETLGVSRRTLRRRCVHAVGYGPKTLERILRFRRALRLLRASQPPAVVAQLAGYCDQAHLTNETHRLAGATPAALMKAGAQVPISANGYN
jgi:AraC-like DNA-binding protein